MPIHDPGNWGLAMIHVPGPGVVHQGCGICGLQLLELPAGQFALYAYIYTYAYHSFATFNQVICLVGRS